jgi:hypothetical protein
MLVGGPFAHSDLIFSVVAKASLLALLVVADIEFFRLFWRVYAIIVEIWVDVVPDFVAFCLVL